MSDQIKRWTPFTNDDTGYGEEMYEDEGGDFVEYCDYIKLEAKYAELEMQYQSLQKSYQDVWDRAEKAEAKVVRFEQENQILIEELKEARAESSRFGMGA